MALPDFWDNKDKAQKDVEQVSELRAKVEPFRALESRSDDLGILVELASE